MLRYVISTLMALAICMAAWAKPAVAEEITLNSSNLLVLRGEVGWENMVKLSHKVLTSKADKIYLFIDSPGGSIFSGLKLVEAIKASDKTVVCIANTAISMAFIIFQACDERLIVPDAVLMQHMPSYGMEGQEPNNYQFAKFIHSVGAALYKMQAERMGMRVADFYTKVRDDWWMFDDEGVKNNAADRMVTVKCSPELLQKYTVETQRIFIFVIKIKFSGCPLIAGPVEDDAKTAVPGIQLNSPAFQRAYTRVMDSYNSRSAAEKMMRTRSPKIDLND